MDTGIKIAMNGMLIKELQQQYIANNLANLNTDYYKSKNIYILKSNEELFHKVYYNIENGTLLNTNNIYDLYLDKNIFFKVIDSNNNEYYSKDGRLSINSEGYLVFKNYYVLDDNNNKIQINNPNYFIIDRNGYIIQNGVITNKLGLYEISKENIKKIDENNLFLADKTEKIYNNKYNIVMQGYRESSNVDKIEQIIKMINGLHIYEACQKALTANDEIISKTIQEHNKF